MQRRLTITVDAEVYEGFRSVAGPGGISRFINKLARSIVVGRNLDAGYAAMAADEAQEAKAEEWVRSLASDVADEPRRGE